MNKNWNEIPSDEVISKTAEAIKARGIDVKIVNTKEEALNELKNMLPEGSGVASGTSTTLNQIGFTDYVQNNDKNIVNLNAKALAENDMEKRGDLRRELTTANIFLGSVNAISQEGELIAVDGTGSRVSAYPFAAKKLILVAGANKIAENLEMAMKRIKEHVWNLENERAKVAYGTGTTYGKWVIIERELNPNRIKLILVKEELGF